MLKDEQKLLKPVCKLLSDLTSDYLENLKTSRRSPKLPTPNAQPTAKTAKTPGGISINVVKIY